MIRVNLMAAAEAAAHPKPMKAVKVKPEAPAKVEKPKVQKAPSESSHSFLTGLVAILLVLSLGLAYLKFVGVPAPLQGKLPPALLAFLDIEEPIQPPDAAPLPEAPEAPELVAQGERPARPAVPANGAVEEIVSTMRPELFIKPVRTEYRELLPTEKVRYQKMAFAQMLANFYALTPEGLGYLDLAYKAPDYFYVRGLAGNPKIQESFLVKLKQNSRDFKVSSGKGTPEFTAYGTLLLGAAPSGEALQLIPAAQLNKEILALRDLSLDARVKLVGLDKPQTTSYGLYQRSVLRATTHADYPSLLRLADKLKESPLRVGVLQFTSRPTLEGGMSSVVEFVLYSAP